MKQKRRIVTTSVRGGSRPKRTPTIRPIRSPFVRPTSRAAAGAGGAVTAAPSGPRAEARLGAPVEEVSAALLESIDLSVDLAPDRGGLVLANPILVASGTFGYGIEYGDVVDVQRLGAICCKGTTLKPRVGNQTPRVTETPGGGATFSLSFAP